MKQFIKILLFIVIIIFIDLFFIKSNFKLNDYYTSEIVYVIDGDTVTNSLGEKIRIIGINTPELINEELSYEAKKFAEDKLLNKKVFLEKDIEDEDRYGRKLRYIWLEIPEKINEETIIKYNFSGIILENGLARKYTFEPNGKYKDIFKNIEKNAIKNKVGMWEISSEGTTRGNEI